MNNELHLKKIEELVNMTDEQVGSLVAMFLLLGAATSRGDAAEITRQAATMVKDIREAERLKCSRAGKGAAIAAEVLKEPAP